jgi:hypothetical protein
LDSKLGAIVVGNGSHQAEIQATDEHPLSRNSIRGGGLPSAIKTKSEPLCVQHLLVASAISDDRFEMTWTIAPLRARPHSC